VISIPAEGLSEELDSDSEEILQECLRIIHSKLSQTSLSEETVSVPSEAEAEITFSGDSIVIELPIESPKSEVSEEEAEEINEAVSMAGLLLEKGFLRKLGDGALKLTSKPWFLPVATGVALGADVLMKNTAVSDAVNSVLPNLTSGAQGVVDTAAQTAVQGAQSFPTTTVVGGLSSAATFGPMIKRFFDNRNPKKLTSKILGLDPQEREDYEGINNPKEKIKYLNNIGKGGNTAGNTKTPKLSPLEKAEEMAGMTKALKPTNSNNPKNTKAVGMGNTAGKNNP
jgi:hypothetical protein